MNNEPVAWMFEKDGAYMCIKHDNRVNYDGGIPLYTHPVDAVNISQEYVDKTQNNRHELTDEEILEELFIPKSEWNSYKAHHCLKQIRAILRKASEK